LIRFQISDYELSLPTPASLASASIHEEKGPTPFTHGVLSGHGKVRFRSAVTMKSKNRKQTETTKNT